MLKVCLIIKWYRLTKQIKYVQANHPASSSVAVHLNNSKAVRGTPHRVKTVTIIIESSECVCL